MLVEVRHPDFAFWTITGKPEPTGHYMRGVVDGDLPESGTVRVYSLFDGNTYTVNVADIVQIKP